MPDQKVTILVWCTFIIEMLQWIVSEDHCNLGREMSHADFKLSVVILNGFLGRCLVREIIRETKISWAFQYHPHKPFLWYCLETAFFPHRY